MEERDIIKYGIIVVLILSAIGITFHFLSSSSHNTPSISQLSKKINVTSFSKTFNLTKYQNKTITGTLTYSLALNSSYIGQHYAVPFLNYYSSLPIVFSFVNPYTHQSYVNITSNKRIFINESYAEVIINLNGNYAFIKIEGNHNNIYIFNGLYTIQMPTTVPNHGKNNTIIAKDSYPVD